MEFDVCHQTDRSTLPMSTTDATVTQLEVSGIRSTQSLLIELIEQQMLRSD